MPTVMFVHAHPDDETTKAGPTSAQLAAQGVRTVLVCCTDGSAGEVTDEALLQGRPLAMVRSAELAASARVLGFDAVHELGFADSGFEGEVAEGFASTPLDIAVKRVGAIFETERPDVVVTYDPRYAAGHPDHARCHEVTAAAFEAATELGFGPRKLYGARNYSIAQVTAMHDWLKGQGRRSPYRKAIEAATPENFTARIFVGDHILTARHALREHRTQVAHDHPWFYAIPDEAIADVYPWEEFELLAVHPDFDQPPLPNGADLEADLLTGLR